jgi:uncharacterized protein DUF3551
MKAPHMRNMPLIWSALAATLWLGVQPSTAETTYPWCARYAQDNTRACSVSAPDQCRVPVSGTVNCGFASYEQCRAALNGNGGSCEQNPMFSPGLGSVRARGIR